MSFPPAFLDELRNRLPVSEIVGRKVRLQRKGREHVGLCPFHNEKTPSFTVSDDKGFFHCFGCGAHGDVISFVMQSDSLGFPESVEQLAGLAGLAVPRESPEARRAAERQKSLADVLEAACRWFETQLRLPHGRVGADYLKGRGLTGEVAKRFRLGYAPGEGVGRGMLKAALAAEGVEEGLIVEAGLWRPPQEGRSGYDYFRDRVIFPITDRRGRVIAFGGRVLGDGQPKYLNSPDSPLFHKGRTLYGLAQAREAATGGADLLVTEGYMDVIALHQGGFPAAVAPLGTALTEHHIEELWRLAAEPVLCFDGDAAGMRAAARAAERALPLLRPGRSLRFAALPAGDDPDTLIRRQGPAAVARLVAGALPLAEFTWQQELAAAPYDTPERFADLRRRLRERERQIADREIQESYRGLFGRHLDEVSPFRGREHATGRRGPFRPAATPGQVDRQRRLEQVAREARPGGEPVTSRRAQEAILAVVLNHPALIEEVGEALAALLLGDPRLDNLLREILDIAASHAGLDAVTLRRHLLARRLSDLCDGLTGGLAMSHAVFARPEAPIETARGGLFELLARVGKAQLESQLAETMQRFETDPSEANWLRIDAIRRALAEVTAGRPAEPEAGYEAADGTAGIM